MKLILIGLMMLINVSCAGFDQQRLGLPFIVPEVNDMVNQTPYLADDENWGLEDYWTTPKEFYNKRRGDCEDYAIAKYFALKTAGFPTQHMFLAVGYINNEPSDGHMYLLIQHHGKLFVLDNIEQDVKPLKEAVSMEIEYLLNEHGVMLKDSDLIWPTRLIKQWTAMMSRKNAGY